MKTLSVIFFLVMNINTVFAVKAQRPYKYPTDDQEIIYNTIHSSSISIFKQLSKLQKIKLLILNGQLNKALILLNSSSIDGDYNKKIKLRYKALIQFIQGDYLEVINTLSDPIMMNIDTMANTCFLKTLSYAILDRQNQLKEFWKTCREASLSYSDTNLTWMQIIVDLKTTKKKNYVEKLFSDVSIDNVQEKNLRIYLKLALYLNSQDKIIDRFKYFGPKPLEDEVTRELIGLNYFRNGQLVKAHQLLKDLNTPNAEVFRGNIYLYQKKFDLAYAQYKLALQLKNNSQNALEKLLPLSWKLKQWNDTIQYAQMIDTSFKNDTENDTLLAATLTMLNKHESAEKILNKIRVLSQKGEPLEVSQLMALNQMELDRYENIDEHVYTSCMGRDAIHCWYLMSSFYWESLSQSLKNDTELHSKTVDFVDLYTQNKFNDPIEEDIFIPQKNVEELDNSLINLIPVN